MIKLATVFSGIGAIEHALKRMNLENEIVFACDNGDVEILTKNIGMDSRKPVLLTASMISCGSTVSDDIPSPAVSVMDEIIPCTISEIPVMSSIPYITSARATINRRNSLKACSGLLTSCQLVQVLINPHTKKRTKSASPIA